jgi:hypothetical protein
MFNNKEDNYLNNYFEEIQIGKGNYPTNYFESMKNNLGIQLSHAWRYAKNYRENHLRYFKERALQIIEESDSIELQDFMNLVTRALSNPEEETPYFRNQDDALVICQETIQDELDNRKGDWKVYG